MQPETPTTTGNLTPAAIREGNARVIAFLDRSTTLSRADMDAIADAIFLITLRDECAAYGIEVN